MYGKAMLALGFIVVWTFLSLLPRPGFGPNLPPELIFVTNIKFANPTVQLIASGFHDAGYEEAWIQFIDEKERLGQGHAVDSRIVIVFCPKNREDLARYTEGA